MDTKIETKEDCQQVEANTAYEVHRTILELKKKMGMAFVQMGMLLKEIRDNEYFKILAYDSFDSYIINSELGFKKRTAYYYIEIYDWYVKKLELEVSQVADYGYDKLLKVLSIIKKEFEETDKYPFEQLKERTIQLLTEASELRPVDFEKKYKDDSKQKGFEDYLAPPEYFRCQCHGKWHIVIPVDDCCPDWLKSLKKYADKNTDNGENKSAGAESGTGDTGGFALTRTT